MGKKKILQVGKKKILQVGKKKDTSSGEKKDTSSGEKKDFLERGARGNYFKTKYTPPVHHDTKL